MELLDAIAGAVGNSTDGGLRDFAAKCMAEFLKWSVKQATTKVRTCSLYFYDETPITIDCNQLLVLFPTEAAKKFSQHKVIAQATV